MTIKDYIKTRYINSKFTNISPHVYEQLICLNHPHTQTILKQLYRQTLIEVAFYACIIELDAQVSNNFIHHLNEQVKGSKDELFELLYGVVKLVDNNLVTSDDINSITLALTGTRLEFNESRVVEFRKELRGMVKDKDVFEYFI